MMDGLRGRQRGAVILTDQNSDGAMVGPVPD
jgi:hypothetical protein